MRSTIASPPRVSTQSTHISMIMNNNTAAEIVNAAIKNGKVLTIKCPNGDIVTAGNGSVIRWGNSKFAKPSGLEIPTFGQTLGHVVVQQCGRGSATKAVKQTIQV